MLQRYVYFLKKKKNQLFSLHPKSTPCPPVKSLQVGFVYFNLAVAKPTEERKNTTKRKKPRVCSVT